MLLYDTTFLSQMYHLDNNIYDLAVMYNGLRSHRNMWMERSTVIHSGFNVLSKKKSMLVIHNFTVIGNPKIYIFFNNAIEFMSYFYLCQLLTIQGQPNTSAHFWPA